MEGKGRLSSAEYASALLRYKETLKSYREGREIKQLMVMGIKQSTVSSWFSSDRPRSIPDVVIGAALAREFGDTVENAVFGVQPKYKHKSDTVEEIVKKLEQFSENDDLMKEIRGVVRFHISKYLEEHPERAAVGE